MLVRFSISPRGVYFLVLSERIMSTGKEIGEGMEAIPLRLEKGGGWRIILLVHLSDRNQGLL